jgi:deoxyribodipyrimidine photo-lyase
MNTLIYWFRQDLRLGDNAAFLAACAAADSLVPVYCHDPAAEQSTRWGGARVGAHRRAWLGATLADLRAQLRTLGSDLVELVGAPAAILPDLAQRLGATTVYCEEIAAPEERAEVAALAAAGIKVKARWQSSLLEPSALPFVVERTPDVFTAFRNAIEKAGALPHVPLPAPLRIPPMPALAVPLADGTDCAGRLDAEQPVPDVRSSFPYTQPKFGGGETAALAHLQSYFDAGLAQTYKVTRNGLTGTDYSSKFSPWLATGALSPRLAYAALKAAEARLGANDSTYWLWFELLWREHFHFLHLKYGIKLYRGRGLQETPMPTHNRQGFVRWCEGRTGQPFIDAGMRELAATGYLSNRMRQNVASYLIHDLGGDWRAGAAWFESQLLDYDVYSNQGNWLYLAGRGTDPRGVRRFDPVKQARDYDPQGHYQALWSSA